VSGWADKCDSKLRLRTEVNKHPSGEVRSPSQVEHVVRIDNVSVCDLQVSFTSTPKDKMLQYLNARPWKDRFDLDGASSPRKDRFERRRKNLSIAALKKDGEPEVRSELTIESAAQYLDANGNPGGPVEQSVRARLRLTLKGTP
jgi:hypothetical protein